MPRSAPRRWRASSSRTAEVDPTGGGKRSSPDDGVGRRLEFTPRLTAATAVQVRARIAARQSDADRALVLGRPPGGCAEGACMVC
jgi:hypothetical protein